MDIGEPLIAALVAIGELGVIHAEEAQNRSVHVVDVFTLIDSAEAEFIGCAERAAALNTGAGHPCGEAVGVMVAAVLALCQGSAAELRGPDDESGIEEAVGFEVFEKRGDGLVGLFAHFDVRTEEVVVGVVPIVAEIGAAIELNETDAALHEAAGQQALAAKVVSGGFADAVERAGGVRLFGNIDGVRGFGLHAEGEFVGGDAGVEGGVVFAFGEVALVHAGDEIEGFSLRSRADAFWRVQMQNGILATAEHGALVDGGEVARAVGAGPGFHCAIAHDDEGGQILIFAAEAIGGPGTEGGAARKLGAAGAEINGRGVIEGVAMAGTNDGDIVGVFGDMGIERGDFEARFAAAVKVPGGAAHEGFAEVDAAGDKAFAEGAGQRLAVVFSQRRFGIPGVHVADAAVHEEEDDTFRFWGEVRRAGASGYGFLFDQRREGKGSKAFTGAG